MAVADEQLDQLYGAALEEFTSKRNALAKELREDGDRKAAAEVKKLKKPARAAWLVNQLSRRKRKDVERLLKTGEELRELQERILAGSVDPAKLRAAAADEQKQIGSLLKAAEAIGAEHGVGSQILDRVGETLQAASADPEIAATVGRGRLERERRASGIGLGGATAPPKRSKGGSRDDDAKRRKAEREQARRRKEAERKLASAEKRLEREQGALERARETVAEREKAVRSAERDRDAARRDAEDFQDSL